MLSVEEIKASAGPLVGAQVWSGSPSIAEQVASYPFDFIYLDTEHTPYESFEAVAGLVRAIEARGKAVWARARDSNPQVIGKLIELGIQAVAVPHVNNADQAQRAAAAAHLPPRGTRGFCPMARRYEYGAVPVAKVEESLQPLIFVMIEDFAAMPHLEEILATDIDGIIPGIADMSWTHEDPSVRGNWSHPLMRETFDQIVEVANRHGKLVLASAATLMSESLRDDLGPLTETYFKKGVHAFTVASDLVMVRNACQDLVTALGRS